MLEIIKKSISLGLGIATVTKEKVESLVDELIEKGELAKEERPKAIKELLEQFQKSETEFKTKTSAAINEALNNLGFATQKDIKELKRIISSKLENKSEKEENV